MSCKRPRRGSASEEEDELDMRVAEEATDFSSWSSDRLRAFLEARGAEHELVTEHADLVSLAHETEAATGAA